MAPALRHRNLPQLLLQSREALMGHFRPLLHAEGLTDQQWRILRTLLQDGPLEPHQLCVRCALSSPSLTGVLQRMDEAGWIRRERMAEDGRRLKVSATARSRRLGQRMLPAIEARYAQLEAALGMARLQQVYDDLDALMASLAALGTIETIGATDEPCDDTAPGAATSRRRRAARDDTAPAPAAIKGRTGSRAQAGEDARAVDPPRRRATARR